MRIYFFLCILFFSAFFFPGLIFAAPSANILKADNSCNIFIIYNKTEWLEQTIAFKTAAKNYFKKSRILMIPVGNCFRTGFKSFMETHDLSGNNDIIAIFGHGDPYRIWSTTEKISGITSSPKVKQLKISKGIEYEMVSNFNNLYDIEKMILFVCSPAGEPDKNTTGNIPKLDDYTAPNIVEALLASGVRSIDALEEPLWNYVYKETCNLLIPVNINKYHSYTLSKIGYVIKNNNTIINSIYFSVLPDTP